MGRNLTRSFDIISHHAFDRRLEVNFGERIFGASRALESSLGASNSRDSFFIRWRGGLILRRDREPQISR
jgi:hypothetical protein